MASIVSRNLRALKRYQGIETGPIYVISTHGQYEFTNYAAGVPFEVNVPPNMPVIESGIVGQTCFFLRFLQDLEHLFRPENREKFLKYLAGDDMKDDDMDVFIKTWTALSVCTIYRPGAKIINRILTLDGGRMDGKPVRHTPYAKMGFFKYSGPAGGAAPEAGGGGAAGPQREAGGPEEILKDVQTLMIEQPESTITTQQMMAALSDSEFQIVIFPTCAVIRGIEEGPEYTKFRDTIASVQMAARENWLTKFTGTHNNNVKNVAEYEKYAPRKTRRNTRKKRKTRRRS
jgi:hypothetical protein